MPKDYLAMFNRFIRNSNRMASTYKPVFLRALLDVGDLHDPNKAKKLVGRQWLEERDGKLVLDLNFIAARFAKYYWDMEYGFRLRQSQDRQDANITRLIRDIHDPEKKPPTIEELAAGRMDGFRKVVINKSIKREVLVHLKTDMANLYTKTSSTTIELDYDVVEFFHTHKTILSKGITGVMAKYLEKLNRMTPQIANKIDSVKATRPQLHSSMEVRMQGLQDSKCFYCGRDYGKYHVDHVIPFNYVFATDPYNCTLACQQCNCTKSDRLPVREIFTKVLERNQTIIEHIRKITDYSEKSYMLLFDSCLVEYNRDDQFFKPDDIV